MTIRDARIAAPVQRGQRSHRPSLIFDSDVRVLHSLANIGVTGQLSGLGHRRAIPEEFSNVRVAASGMKVGDALGRLVSNADALQVLLDHQPGAAVAELREQEFIAVFAVNPLSNHAHECRMQRQNIFTPVL